MTKSYTTTTQRIHTLKQIVARKDIRPCAKLVAMALLIFHMNNSRGQCNPSVSLLAKETGIRASHIYRYIAELEQKVHMDWSTKNNNFNFDLADEPPKQKKAISA